MARTMKITKFNLENSEMIGENERILSQNANNGMTTPPNGVTPPEAVKTAKKEDCSSTTSDVSSTTAPTAEQEMMQQANSDFATDLSSSRGRKSERGITVYVPMDYYERIVLMKMRTGVPVKDIALKAVLEYVDRHRND